MQEHSAGAGTLREVKIRADHYSADSAESRIRKEGKEKGGLMGDILKNIKV